MKTIIKIFIAGAVFFSVLFGINIAKAQDNTLLYFSKQPQAANYNPSFTTNAKIYVTPPLLGSFSLNIQSSGFAWNDLINKNPIYKDSLRLDIDGFLGKLKDNNKLSLDMNFDIIGIGFKTGKNYFSLGANINIESKVGFTKELFDFLVHGTGMANKNSDILDGELIDATAYMTTYFGYAREINDKLTVGTRLKLYTGLANIHTNKSLVNLQFNDDEIAAYGDFDIATSIFFGHLKTTNSVMDSNSKFEFEAEDNVADGIKKIKDNKGFGFDIGATYKINDKMQISASIVDLGKITWKANVSKIRSRNPKQRISFSGVDVQYNTIEDDLKGYFDDMADSLKSAFDLEVVEATSYSTSVPTKIYLGYSWEFLPNMNLQALYNGRFIGGSYENAMTLSCSYLVGQLQIAIGNTFKYRWFNPSILFSLDNVLYLGARFSSSYNLAKTTGVVFYGGVNIAIGNKDKTSSKTND